MTKQSRITIRISDELGEWIKNYQYTLMIKSNESISIQEILEEALHVYRQMQSIEIVQRPDFLIQMENKRKEKIQKTQQKNANILKSKE